MKTQETPAARAATKAAASRPARPAWLVGGALLAAAVGSLATVMALRGPHAAFAAGAIDDPADTSVQASSQPREQSEEIVSTLSPAPAARPAATAATRTAGSTATTATRPAVCADCAVVESVIAVERGDKPSGVGAVAGAVAGGLIGNQMGGGSGKDAMTVIGAVGGGVAGHQIEKRSKTRTEYQVRLRMDDGTRRTLVHPTRLAAGDRVRVNGERIVVAAAAGAGATAVLPQASTVPVAAAEPADMPPRTRPRSMAEAKRLL